MSEKYAPCVNPKCKSYGKSHPNCKDYDNADVGTLQSLESQGYELPGVYRGGRKKKMAEGGDVAPSCPDCGTPYMADGGDAIPTDQVVLDSAPMDASAQAPDQSEEIPVDQVKLDAPEIPSDQVTLDKDKYSTPGQQALTVAEGVGKGFAGPIATAAELGLSKMGVPGLSAEEQEGRQAANPVEHGTAEAAGLGLGLYTGVGELGLLAKIPEVAALGKVGGAVVKGAIEMGAIQGGDEISKAMLGQGDPEAPVSAALAHVGAAALYGGVTGGVFGVIGYSASKLQDVAMKKLEDNATGWLVGFGVAASVKNGSASPELMEAIEKAGDQKLLNKAVRDGIQSFDKMHNFATSQTVKSAADLTGGLIGSSIGGVPGALVGAAVAHKVVVPTLEKMVGKTLGMASKRIEPAIFRMISTGNTMGTGKIVNYATKVSKGVAMIHNGVEGLFKSGGSSVIDAYATEKDREKLKKFIEEGGLNKQIENQLQSQPQPAFAEGGVIDQNPQVALGVDPVARVFPEQAALMNAAKGRIYNYLNSLRPQDNPQKLPFDVEMKNPSQERMYNRALDIANQPLTILNHIKNGELTPETLKHFTSMYPELHNHLNKKITERMLQAQMDEEKPSYKVRQSMSLFLGAPLDSSFTPASIMAAQGVYAQQQAMQQPQPGGKPKKGTSSMSKISQSYQTEDQARNARAQKS